MAIENLLDLKIGQSGVVQEIEAADFLKERLHHLGLIEGTTIRLVKMAPWGSPRVYQFLNTQMAFRNNLAKKIKICLPAK